MKTWIIIAIILAVVVVGAVAYTMTNPADDSNKTGTPVGETVGCEPCTEGCACGQGPGGPNNPDMP